MSDVTRMLSAIERGEPHAAEHLLPLLYDELRKLACDKMAPGGPGRTLPPTARVHKAYLRLTNGRGTSHWERVSWSGRSMTYGAFARSWLRREMRSD